MTNRDIGIVRMHYRFEGRVQHVGFRFTAQQSAVRRGLTGFVRNEDDGSVTMEVQGAAAEIAAMYGDFAENRWIRIDAANPRKQKPISGERGFRIVGN
ncbi:MAG: acylphosphatase [Stomatobaculum sp.]